MRETMLAAAIALIGVQTAGCPATTTTPRATTPQATGRDTTPTTRPASAPTPEPLPAGTLARARGKQGPIEVVERDGRRLLLIGGVVQGAARLPLGKASGPLGLTDPLVALIRAGVDQPTKQLAALVIGLGTGQTAAALTRAGFGKVDVVELEPKVIDLARRHFGYRGPAVAGDGLAYLEGLEPGPPPYDVILVDAYTTTALPAHLVSSKALALMRSRLRGPSLVAVRLVGSPEDHALRGLVRRLDRQAPTYLFGSGVGGEKQNLYLLSGAARFSKVEGVAAWPLRLGGRSGSHLHAALNRPRVPALDVKATADPTTRQLTVIGYLVWDRRGQGPARLALDLPHDEMGMMRYLLSGPPVEALTRRHGKAIVAPTSSERNDERWISNSAIDLLGGASTCGTGQEVSPVVVALRGTARLVSTTPHYGPWPLLRARMRHGAPQQRRRWMRAGQGAGALYALSVERVLAALDKRTWRRLLGSPKLGGPLRRGERLARAGKLAAAAAELDRARAAILAAIPGVLGEHLQPSQQLAQLARLMRKHAAAPAKGDGAKGDGAALARAVACDRVFGDYGAETYTGVKTSTGRLRRALRACAVAGYSRLARSAKRPGARAAAGRLLYLLDYDGGQDDGGRKRVAGRIARLKKRFGPDLRPLDRAPAPQIAGDGQPR